jgi:hypothetical protein
MFLQNKDVEPIPATGLSMVPQFALFLLIAIVGSIIAMFLFPRIFCPLFMKSKQLIKKHYKNGFILQSDPAILSGRKFLIRAIYIFLLELGFLAIALPLINPASWIPGGSEGLKYYTDVLGVPGQYTMIVLITFTSIFLPFVVGLWSIGWTLQDQGIMHYKFDDRPGRELYEIEPVHLNYNTYLKGYAGISSIIFLIQVAITWMNVKVEPRTDDIIFTFVIPLGSIIIAIPAYFIYAKFVGSKDFLRKDLIELKKLTEADVKKAT